MVSTPTFCGATVSNRTPGSHLHKGKKYINKGIKKKEHRLSGEEE